MMFGLKCATHMMTLLRLSLHIEIPITDSTRLFSQKPEESLDDCFARFESIVSSLHSCDPIAYSDNECAKQLLYALDDSVLGMKITTLEDDSRMSLDLLRGTGNSIGGDLDVDDEGSEQRQFEPM
jgi:hypothetical protein